MDTDYMQMGLTGISEWRRPVDNTLEIRPKDEEDYELITTPNTAYTPNLLATMEYNSSQMLTNTLKYTELNPLNSTRKVVQDIERLSDNEIISKATLNHTIPLMVATDGSYENNSATASIVILGPDVRDEDEVNGNEWCNREALPLLIRTIHLPEEIGTEKTINNTAELVGIILQTITIPIDIVTLIITDSETAKAITCGTMHEQSHRKMIRRICQGVSQSLTNLLRQRTEKWKLGDIEDPPDLLATGQQLLRLWARTSEEDKNEASDDDDEETDNDNTDEEEANQEDESDDPEEDDESIDDITEADAKQEADKPKREVKFNQNQWATIGKNLICRVYSHQKENPSPNTFCVSANNMADEEAKKAHKIPQLWRSQLPRKEENKINIPPFSNPYTYIIKSKAADKGATKVFKEGYEAELKARLELRIKQGLFMRHIDDIYNVERLTEKKSLRDVAKGIATVWTRALYMKPELATKVLNLNINSTPLSSNNNWQKHEDCHEVKRCPFCTKDAEGDIEHLHAFCQNERLVQCRNRCNSIIESQLRKICETDESLEETLGAIAREEELKDRRTLIDGKRIELKKRIVNCAVVNTEGAQNMMDIDEVSSYIKESLSSFPLSHKCGLITAMEESQYDPAQSTIVDIAFTGLCSKALIKKIPKESRALLVKSIEARTTTMQEVTYALIKEYKKSILEEHKEVHRNTFDADLLIEKLKSKCPTRDGVFDWITFGRECGSCFNKVPSRVHFLAGPLHAIMEENTSLSANTRCDGAVCQIYKPNEENTDPKNTINIKRCNTCVNEFTARKATTRLEETFLREQWPDTKLQEIFTNQSISLLNFKLILQRGSDNMGLPKDPSVAHLTTTYFAHSLAIKVNKNQLKGDIVGEMSDKSMKSLWDRSKHTCRCPTPNKMDYVSRSFCRGCKLIMKKDQEPEKCQGCLQPNTNLCHHCRLANILFKNRIEDKVQERLEENQNSGNNNIIAERKRGWCRPNNQGHENSSKDDPLPQSRKRRRLS